MDEHIKHFGHVAGYSFAALLGVIGANYVDTYTTSIGQPIAVNIVGGLILLGVPVFAMKKAEGWMGALRLLLGVAGMALLLRGVLSPSMPYMKGVTLPTQISGVI